MRLRVRALNGHTTEVDGLDPNDTIESVKLRVFHSMQIPTNLQRLIFAGREMQDQLKLIDANLQDNAILHIVVRAQAQRPTTEFTPIEHQSIQGMTLPITEKGEDLMMSNLSPTHQRYIITGM